MIPARLGVGTVELSVARFRFNQHEVAVQWQGSELDADGAFVTAKCDADFIPFGLFPVGYMGNGVYGIVWKFYLCHDFLLGLEVEHAVGRLRRVAASRDRNA